MTREERKIDKAKTIQNEVNLRARAQEVAEKVKNLTPNKVSLENYEDYKRFTFHYGYAQDVLSQYKSVKKSLVVKAALVAVGLIGVAVTLPIVLVLNIMGLALLAGISIGVVAFAGMSFIDGVSDLEKLNNMEVVAIFKALKKQNLLGKLDEVFNEYEQSEKHKQDVATRQEEYARKNEELQKMQLDKEVALAERQTRILPKLLELLKENNAQSLYEIKVDDQNHTAIVKSAERGRPISKVSSEIRRLIENGVEVNFED